MTKPCVVCGCILPATAEYFDRRTKTGGPLSNRCKQCRKKAQVDWLYGGDEYTPPADRLQAGMDAADVHRLVSEEMGWWIRTNTVAWERSA